MTQAIMVQRKRNKLILPNQPYYDEFLEIMSKVFKWLRLLGVAGGEKLIWKVWGAFVLCLFIAIECQAIWKVIKALAGWAADTTGNRSVTVRLAGTMFYTGTMIGLVLCWRLSSSWKALSKYWLAIEVALSIKYVPSDKQIRNRIRTAIIAVALCSFIEHLMSVVTAFDFDCPLKLCLRRYMLKSHGFMFLEHQYKDWYTVPLLFMSNLATIIWNLQDLLVMLISMGLTSRYRRLNQCVATVSGIKQDKNWSQVHTWRKIREAYVKQANLVRKVSRHLGLLILMSTFFNFYFICLQLFLGITHGLSESLLKQIYYIISFTWLCLRTIFSILTAASVNRSSKTALPYLYQCPPHLYNIEIERLQNQLNEDYVALSGMGLFYLKRAIVLQMAAAVLTYALVLIQYDSTH